MRDGVQDKAIRQALAYLADLHIAAHARSEGLTLVSNNLREFESVEALQNTK
ncbi:hypothetical protein [Polaromonas sp. UBA4122]|uniref:hypothetical protein n=1 Tax=Polaromonas sp. UBA4122 TaxID=1947074 RepID=UPI0025E3A1D1|nr:hypothetical protein [Polaromonas sp. UBA4122]